MTKTRSTVSGYSILWIALALIATALVLYFSNARSFVPENFAGARNRSSEIAADLVKELDASVKGLDQISEADKSGNFSLALALVDQENKRIDSAKTKALDLSKELISMAQAIYKIKPEAAKKVALDAVVQETTLLSHLTNYNAYFGSLLQTLKLKFVGNLGYSNNDVQIYINNMNREAGDINNLNESFNQKLKEFDDILRA